MASHMWMWDSRTTNKQSRSFLGPLALNKGQINGRPLLCLCFCLCFCFLFLRDKEACLNRSIGYPYLKPHTAVFSYCIGKVALSTPLLRLDTLSLLLCGCYTTYPDYPTVLVLTCLVPGPWCSAGVANLRVCVSQRPCSMFINIRAAQQTLCFV